MKEISKECEVFDDSTELLKRRKFCKHFNIYENEKNM